MRRSRTASRQVPVMEFQGKSEDFVEEWLRQEGFKENVVAAF